MKKHLSLFVVFLMIVVLAGGGYIWRTSLEPGEQAVSVDGETAYNGNSTSDTGESGYIGNAVTEYGNIVYNNNGDRIYFSLKGAVLTELDEPKGPSKNGVFNKMYTEAYDKSGKEYSIVFPTEQADLESGLMEINDKHLHHVKIKKDEENGTTSLTFYAKDKYSYLVYTRGSSDITTITVIKPATEKQKIVAIDAGHGGKAVGAIYKNLYEKDINLDIGQRLNKLLEAEGVETYMIRENDDNIGNYERAYIANTLDARLYLSIHCNASESKSFKGTMTLYCPTFADESFTGKTFANIIQKNLIAALKTDNLDIRRDADIIVLRETVMPSALAEIAYMTNSEDRENLLKDSFKQKAAQALCDSIIEALSKI